MIEQLSLSFRIAPDNRQNIGRLLDPFVGGPSHRLGSFSLGHRPGAAFIQLAALLLQSLSVVGNYPQVTLRAFNIVSQSLCRHLARHHFALFSRNRCVQQDHRLFQTGETRP